jgi:hypothetical protein
VPALAVQHDPQCVGAGERGAGPEAEQARGDRGHVLAEHDCGDAEPLEKAVGDHRLRALAFFLGRLEDQQEGSAPRRGVRGERRGGAEQAGHVHVVAARVHQRHVFAVAVGVDDGARVVEAGPLTDRQRVHVGAQQHRRSRAVPEHAYHAGPADACRRLIAQVAEPAGDDARRPVLVKGEFWMRVQVTVDPGQVGDVSGTSHGAQDIAGWFEQPPQLVNCV